MSRFKRVVAGSALAAALVAVPVVPAFAHQAAPVVKTAAMAGGTPGCMDCWS